MAPLVAVHTACVAPNNGHVNHAPEMLRVVVACYSESRMHDEIEIWYGVIAFRNTA